MPRVVIIGKGNIGNAIASILRPKKIDIAFWDTDPKKLFRAHTPVRQKILTEKTGGLAEIIPGADFVFLCVPSFAVPSVMLEIKPYLSRRTTCGECNRTTIVSLAKGIDKKSGATMDELLDRTIPHSSFALLSGPMLAGELSQAMGGAAVIASKNIKVQNAVARLFKNTELRVAISADIHGVALAGVLKNIYAIAVGAADGAKDGYNARGLLLGTAQSEIADIIPLMGGAQGTATIPALIGDLFATGMSPASNNHTFGVELVSGARRGPKPHLFTEGMFAAPFIAKRLGDRLHRFPLLGIAVVLVKQPKEGKKKLQAFLPGRE
jgi:glycerol-3-phosphate dehydrogenase (NAD(P)+)